MPMASGQILTGSSRLRVESGPEPAGLEQAPGDVVGEVAEAERGAAEVLKSSVEGLGRPVAGTGSVEVRQDVFGPLLQRSSERDELGQRGRDAAAERVDEVAHQPLALGPVGLAVRADHALVNAPGGLDLDVLVDGEQRGQPLLLPVGEQVGAGVQGPPGAVERVVGAAAVPCLLYTSPSPRDS